MIVKEILQILFSGRRTDGTCARKIFKKVISNIVDD